MWTPHAFGQHIAKLETLLDIFDTDLESINAFLNASILNVAHRSTTHTLVQDRENL